jgi:hypothetical protein
MPLIAEKMNIAVSTVHRDITLALKEIQEDNNRKAEEIRADRILKLKRIEREAFLAFEKSKRQAEENVEEITETVQGGVIRKEVTKTRGQCGDPRFLKEARECNISMAKLEGVYNEQPDPTVNVNVFAAFTELPKKASGNEVDAEISGIIEHQKPQPGEESKNGIPNTNGKQGNLK